MLKGDIPRIAETGILARGENTDFPIDWLAQVIVKANHTLGLLAWYQKLKLWRILRID